jgi:hypothetical protein
MKCFATLETLKEPAEKALRDLGCEFYTTRTTNELEFEVTKPENFIARITRLTPLNYSFGMSRFTDGLSHFTGRSGAAKGREISEVDIITFGETSLASEFVKRMVAYMIDPPWMGLKGSESVKGEWEEWLG